MKYHRRGSRQEIAMNRTSRTEQILDRVLREQEEVEPSPEFVGSVMARVHREAAAPPPLSFPWRRVAVAGLAGLATAIVLVLVLRGVLPNPAGALEGLGHSGELPGLLGRVSAVLLVTWLATAIPRWLVS
jgi:hypothetical protein